MPMVKFSTTQSERLFPQNRLTSERIVALSLLDATSVDFQHTCAIWLFEAPEQRTSSQFNLSDHLRQSLQVTLGAYPQWCGRLKIVNTLSNTAVAGEEHLPPHARRFGRVHVVYGSSQDPGVEFTVASSETTLDALCSVSRAVSQVVWNRKEVPLTAFVSQTQLQNLVKPVSANDVGLFPPVMAVQLTTLACGGFVLTVNCVHPLADAHSVIHFVKDLASVSRSILQGADLPSLSPSFEPDKVDSSAAGDINALSADPAIVQEVERLPLHRYDWWTQAPGSSRTPRTPEVFQNEDLSPAGKPIPWHEWDVSAPPLFYDVHLTSE
ncbi:hypothetical protein EYZ11_001950 [Aspergillus tanneri]|uniref:Uncharacterized protein n=1 Tax=Aspergillus tanneri TaxID=1220188 RepID=A0A4S3JTJ5_9EURO|nr:uncharacterized protein ATNIH1004_007492 [Aspergillus tanneri]KAA8646069.1 hypothetical protein ATNIH1004_007492 [Aspergillus tanneri]THC98598.1 hypothetical protein EYZ11_001950 [Aspergillus tanneri]